MATKRYVAPISEDEAWRRVMAAIRTLKAMPDAERRFLTSGSRSGWVITLVEWSDLVSQAEDVQPGAPPRDEHDTPPERYQPKRAEISDALVAGEWFAKLAITADNVREFADRLDDYRTGRERSPQVKDQRILEMFVRGYGLKTIGGRFKLNEHQIERRLLEIRTTIAAIANGRGGLVEPPRAQRAQVARQADRASG